ncbi:MAG TPA: hypothetical protein VGM98_22950 [Schlesneria sp.]
MNISQVPQPMNCLIEIVAAELTVATYPEVLRHGVTGSWIDLELGLWKALSTTLQRIGHMPSQSPGGWTTHPDCPPAEPDHNKPKVDARELR